MRVLVTGSSGHLGEALIRTLRAAAHEAIGIDLRGGEFTSHVGSIVDREFVARWMKDVEVVFHAATLHKPHVATHSRQEFIDTNITGTLNLLEESVRGGAKSFIYTSTTSVFGDALNPPPDAPAVWVSEDLSPIPKNIYGVTKSAAEDLCQLFHRNHKLPCVVLRTSRFFPEEDDDAGSRETYSDDNLKVNEFLHRRVDVEDIVSAHLLAAQHAVEIGFRKYIISATTPFARDDLPMLRTDAPSVVRRHVPQFEQEYARRGWKMFPSIGRVYANDRARAELGWRPKHDFKSIIARLSRDEDWPSELARQIGSKGYHREKFANGPYPVD